MVATLVRRCSVTSETVYSARARGEGQGDEDLVGRVRVDRPVGDVLEGEQLVDRLVGDRLGRLAALAEADERAGGAPVVLGDEADGRPRAVARPADELDLGAQPALGQARLGLGAHPFGDPRRELGDPGLAPDADQGAAPGLDQGPELRRLDPGVEPAPAARVEAGRGHRQRDRGAEVRPGGAPGRREEGERRGLRVERAAGRG